MFSYLDAATGSMILAALAGGGAGISVLFRMYWHRFLGRFSEKHRLAAVEERERITSGSKGASDDVDG